MEVIIRQTFVFAIVTLAAYYVGLHVEMGGVAPTIEAAQTMAFLVTGWTSILHVLTVRSRKSIVFYHVKDNPRLYISCAVMLVLLGGLAGLAAIPAVGAALEMSALSGWQWLVVVALTLAPTVVAEYGKFWDYIRSRNAERTRVR